MHSLEIRMSSHGFETSCRGILACQFWKARYERAFQNPIIYIAVPLAAIIVLTLVNLQKTPVWNIIVSVSVFAIISFVFYRDKKDKKYHRVVESECLLLMFGVLEDLGDYWPTF